MLNKDFAHHFADDWIASWNSHDLDRIMSHYTDDFEMTSPFIGSRMGIPSGTIKGKTGVREYWAKSLARFPDLKFTLREVAYSLNSIALYYESSIGKKAVEWFLFNESGLVVKAIAHYNEL